MQPTVIYDSPASVPMKNSLGVSRANVGFVAGDRPHFSEATAALLHSRLSAAALVLAVVLAAFVGNLFSWTVTLWWLRGLVLLMAVGSVVVLRARPSLSLSQLRTLELVVFGSVVIQLSLMLVTRLEDYSRG
jgi:hypothetical protein